LQRKNCALSPQENNIFTYFLAKKIKIVLLAGESDDSLPGVGRRSSKLITFAGP
jgi:hypothetical protein